MPKGAAGDAKSTYAACAMNAAGNYCSSEVRCNTCSPEIRRCFQARYTLPEDTDNHQTLHSSDTKQLDAPMIELVFHTDTGPQEADGSDNQPFLSALYRLHQFGHQPPLQYVAFDPAQTSVFRSGCPPYNRSAIIGR